MTIFYDVNYTIKIFFKTKCPAENLENVQLKNGLQSVVIFFLRKFRYVQLNITTKIHCNP